MCFRYVFGATPAVESASVKLKLFYFIEGVPIEVHHSKLGLLIFSCDFL